MILSKIPLEIGVEFNFKTYNILISQDTNKLLVEIWNYFQFNCKNLVVGTFYVILWWRRYTSYEYNFLNASLIRPSAALYTHYMSVWICFFIDTVNYKKQLSWRQISSI